MIHTKFPKIGQFRDIQKHIRYAFAYKGHDDNGNPIYDFRLPQFVLEAKGYVKIHGTNAAVAYNRSDFWVQKRTAIITPQSDNAGCASFAYAKKDVFVGIIEKQFAKFLDQGATVLLHFEWAGGNIQGGVALCGTEKSAYIFGVQTILNGEEVWHDIDSIEANHEHWIFNVADVGHYEVEIDFDSPDTAIEKMNNLTNSVDTECPVAKLFHNRTGVGEGIVWQIEHNNQILRWKTKGTSHTKSVKPKDTASIEENSRLFEIAHTLTPATRLSQGLEQVFGAEWQPIDLDVKKLGDYIRWVLNDIKEEEMVEDFDQLKKPIGSIARNYFFAASK